MIAETVLALVAPALVELVVNSTEVQMHVESGALQMLLVVESVESVVESVQAAGIVSADISAVMALPLE